MSIIKPGFTAVTLLGLALLMLNSCGSNSEKEGAQETIELPPTATQESVVITIGNLSDLTGVSSNAMEIINMALNDTVDHYNDQNLIPGVEVKVITYDGQWNPSNDIPGYKWLKQNGADLIFTPVSSTAVTLKPYLEKDQMVLFTWAPTEEAITPPGYVFSPANTLCKYVGYTLLSSVAENDPDFPTDRPARIGGAYWAEAYGDEILTGAEEYTRANPEQYEWEDGFLVSFGFDWHPEVDQLKDCDYVMPPVIMTSFVEQYREAGYGAKFLGTSAQLGFLGQIHDSNLWKKLDGALFVATCRWWNEKGTLIDLTHQLLQQNHSSRAQELIDTGVGYQSVYGSAIILEIIKKAVETVGAENFSSQALYDASESFSYSIDGTNRDSFSKTKRTSLNFMGLYEARAAGKDVVRLTAEWHPIVYEP